MDIMMPFMDGWETIQEIANQGYMDGNIIISMFTAKDIPDKKMSDLKEYITDYITKPFDNDELVDKIQKYFTQIK